MVFFLNERKVIEDLMSFFKYIDDKGEFKDFLENESQFNELIVDNEEVCCLVCVCLYCLLMGY